MDINTVMSRIIGTYIAVAYVIGFIVSIVCRKCKRLPRVKRTINTTSSKRNHGSPITYEEMILWDILDED